MSVLFCAPIEPVAISRHFLLDAVLLFSSPFQIQSLIRYPKVYIIYIMRRYVYVATGASIEKETHPSASWRKWTGSLEWNDDEFKAKTSMLWRVL